MNENIVKFIKIHVLTPVHIGAGTDKKWLKDIDFFYDKGKVVFFDLAEILKGKNDDYIVKVANAVTERKLFKDNLVQKNEIQPIFVYSHNKEPDEIFTHIRTGIGNVFIPGSSLKGAITSALLGYLYKHDHEIRQIKRTEKIDEEVFGGVENSVMRLIQIADAGFQCNDLGLFNSKIYSLNFNIKGQWKHQRSGSKPKFNAEGFVSTYECLKYGSKSYTRIAIVKNIIDKIHNIEDKKKPKNLNKILKVQNTDPVVELFKMINQQTRNYLDKEIKFFKKHGGDRSEHIIETLESLKEQANECQPHECILHLGSGSGFHGITGDWQFDSHIITGFGRNGRGQINGRDAAKTRRLIFEEKDGDYVFYPMGFVKLSITDENDYNSFFNALKKDANIKNVEVRDSNSFFGVDFKKSSSTTVVNQKENEVVPFDDKIKQGATGIPAEVVESGKPNKVRIFIKDYTKNDVFVLGGYNNPLEKGKKIYVRLGTINGKGEIIQVSFDKFMT